MPGIVASRISASGVASTTRASASSPRPTVSTSIPAARRFTSRTRWRIGSSSARRTRAIAGMVPVALTAPRRPADETPSASARPIDCPLRAPVAQGIERRPPEPGAQVRILPGARVSEGPDGTLELESLPSDPLTLFQRWFERAEAAGIRLPNAIALATADADGRPSIRHVLLRGVADGGFVFYTNHGSRKGRELAENPRAAFSIYWRELDRQVNVVGDVERVSDEVSVAYFATRPREARLGAWASKQSSELPSREELMERFAEF